MRERQVGTTTHPVAFLLVASADHVTPVTGAAPAVAISKDGAAFGAASGAVTELANGWYSWAGNATDRGTNGGLAVHITAATADPSDFLLTIVPWDPFDGVRLGMTGLANAVPGAAGGLFIAGSNAATSVNITGNLSGSVGSVTTVSDKTGYALSVAGVQAIWDALTSALTTVGSVGKRVADNLDATVSTRSSHTAADVWTSGTRTLTGFGTLVADIWASATRTLTAFGFGVTASSVTDKTGYALTVGEHTAIAADAQTGLTAQGYTSTRAGYLDTLNGLVQAIWDKATSALTTVGSVGKLIKDNLDAKVSSVGGSAPTAATVAAAVWDEAIGGHLTAGTTGSKLNSAGGAGGAGSITFTYTVYASDGVTPLDGCEVYVTTDLAGSTVVAGTLTTDAFGVVTFQLDPGTFYFWRKKSGWNFLNPDVEAVS